MPASRNARYRISRARSSASGSGPSSVERDRPLDGPPRQQRPRLDQDQLARDRDERRHVAHPVVVEGRERVEVGVGQRAERHREHVELARLDQREQQRQRPVERRQRDARRGLGAAALAERDRRRASTIDIRRPRPRAGTAAPYSRVAGLGLVADEVDGEGRQTRRPRPGRPTRRRGAASRSSAAPQPGTARGGAPDPRPERLAQRPGDARPDAGVALGAVVEQAGGQHVAVASRPSGAAPQRRRGRGGGRRRASRRTGRAPRGAARPPAPRAPRTHPGRHVREGAGGP